MFEHVIESFLDGEKDVVAHVGPQWLFRQIGRDFLPTTHRSVFEEFIRKAADIIGKTAQIVIFRIGSPNNFVERLHCRAYLFSNAFELPARRLLALRGAFANVAHDGYAGADATDTAVHVLRHPTPLALDAVLH